MEKLLIKSSEKEWDRPNFLARDCLPKEFYLGHTVDVAQALLGKILVVRNWGEISEKSHGQIPEECTAGRIVETEAYRADDPASHSRRGPTPRSQIMFGDPGVAYVYLIYGLYEMLNFVTEPVGNAGAVLIRALEPVRGEELMVQRRNSKIRTNLTNGPGRLCQAMGITREHGGQSLQGPILRVYDDGYQPTAIECSPRIGISQGTERLWRFFISGNSFVSSPRLGRPINAAASEELTQ